MHVTIWLPVFPGGHPMFWVVSELALHVPYIGTQVEPIDVSSHVPAAVHNSTTCPV
ncbi:MAG: hypothetical protein PQ612_06900 [Rickettsiales bacterium]|nr:hypothetical protein [Pseudomonadota bacterium]MDA0965807.1 hypothetical protein [Pseudomonadota bacterium]MDG4543731.1 hypothetical protein [Rickettsiales bacterium]MDG4545878.1 hypothetical protein [Rickettsiales bacterium]MDG4548124.1 hypothetical protein [Rickettsiales bacterium]